MQEKYEPIKSMKEIPDQLRKLRREYIRYQQAELMYWQRKSYYMNWYTSEN